MGRAVPRQDAGTQSGAVIRPVFRRRWLLAPAALLVFGIACWLWLMHNARAMPVVRRLDIALPFPSDAPRRPVTLAFMSDTHLSGPDNSPTRMARIVRLVNELKPDLVLLGGDYIGDDKGGATYGPDDSIAPFADLKPPLGVVAILGNHDAMRHAGIGRKQWRKRFAQIGVRLLDNQAERRGPLAIGGLRDIYTGKPDIPGTLRAMAAVGGAPVILSHGPDIFPLLPDRPSLALVGHTHCGQVALPFAGIVYVPSRYRTRYACGLYREGRKTLLVSGGIGTSGLPIRLLAPPDVWLVTIRPD